MQAIRQYLPAAVILVGVLVAWEVLVRSSGVQGFILPRAVRHLGGAGRELDRWLRHPAGRAGDAVRGAWAAWSIGTVLGVATAFVVSRFPASRDTVLPLAIAINAIPIIAFAPVANNWFGILSPLSKMAIAAALVYFPIMINVLRGLTQVEPSALELMRSYAAAPAAVTTPAAGPERAALLPDRAQDRDHPRASSGRWWASTSVA